MSTMLFSTEAVSIDLVALRNWHFHCSLDKTRSVEMRKWHRGQVHDIALKLPRTGPGSLSLVKVALIELLAGQARKRIHGVVAGGAPFDWRQMCSEAISELEKEFTSRVNADAGKSPLE